MENHHISTLHKLFLRAQ